MLSRKGMGSFGSWVQVIPLSGPHGTTRGVTILPDNCTNCASLNREYRTYVVGLAQAEAL
jgi:hypothetical protein